MAGFWSKVCEAPGRSSLTKRERGDQVAAGGSSLVTRLWKMSSKPGS